MIRENPIPKVAEYLKNEFHDCTIENKKGPDDDAVDVLVITHRNDEYTYTIKFSYPLISTKDADEIISDLNSLKLKEKLKDAVSATIVVKTDNIEIKIN